MQLHVYLLTWQFSALVVRRYLHNTTKASQRGMATLRKPFIQLPGLFVFPGTQLKGSREHSPVLNTSFIYLYILCIFILICQTAAAFGINIFSRVFTFDYSEHSS